MIDYLEELLGEPEQEETEGGTPDMGAVFLPAGRRAVPDTAGAEPATAGFTDGGEAEQADGESAFMAEVEDGAGYLAAALRRQEGYLAAAQERSWAAGLYRTAVDAGRAAGTLRQSGARVLTVTEQAAPAAGFDVAELDEAFARDARRYDGGFSMY